MLVWTPTDQQHCLLRRGCSTSVCPAQWHLPRAAVEHLQRGNLGVSLNLPSSILRGRSGHDVPLSQGTDTTSFPPCGSSDPGLAEGSPRAPPVQKGHCDSHSAAPGPPCPAPSCALLSPSSPAPACTPQSLCPAPGAPGEWQNLRGKELSVSPQGAVSQVARQDTQDSTSDQLGHVVERK